MRRSILFFVLFLLVNPFLLSFDVNIVDDDANQISNKEIMKVMIYAKDPITGNVFSLAGSEEDSCFWTNCHEDSIALGLIPVTSGNTKFGHGTVGTAAFEEIWDYSVTADSYNFMTSAQTLYVSSSSTDDDAGGTGGLTIEIQGLDADYNVLTEEVNLAGQLTAETTNLFFRVNRVKVIKTGSSKKNAGDIYVHKASNITSGVPDASDKTLVYAKIQAGNGQTLQCVYTVPADKTMLIKGVECTVGESAKAVTFQLYVYEYDKSWQVKLQEQIFETVFESDFNKTPLNVPEKSDVVLRAKASGTAATMGAHWHFTLHDE